MLLVNQIVINVFYFYRLAENIHSFVNSNRFQSNLQAIWYIDGVILMKALTNLNWKDNPTREEINGNLPKVTKGRHLSF